MITIYADGSSTGKVGNGGWSFVVLQSDKVIYKESGGAKETTNNRMELQGVISGLEWAYQSYSNQEIKVISDSQYVVKGITEWLPNWERKIAKGKTIKNQDLWLHFKKMRDLFSNIQFEWVKGHSKVEYNEMCDKLAKQAKLEMQDV